MFGFMKKHSDKDREEKDRKKREKKDVKKLDKRKPEKPLTKEELQRLEEARKGLLKTNGAHNDGSVSPSDSNDSVGSSRQSREVTPEGTYTSNIKVDIGKAMRIPPPTHPKPKKGILKDKSLYGPEIPNHGVRGCPSDTIVTEENTLVNELMSGKGNAQQGTTSSRPQPATIVHPDLKHKSIKSLEPSTSTRTGPPRKPISLTKPKALHPKPGVPVIEPPSDFSDEPKLDDSVPVAPPSPAEKIYANIDLQLPSIGPPRSLKPRTIPLKRLPAGDFGFSLRKGTVLERGVSDNVERKRKVIFAEPGVKNLNSGLLPGDRLLEVNEINVETSSREELIDIIRDAGDHVVLKVQPIPELSELSMRSGVEGEEVHIAEHSVKTGTLQRTGSMRYKSRQAKSDAQIADDKAWLQAEKVWLVHKEGFAAGKLLRTNSGDVGAGGDGAACTCKVKLDASDTVLDVDEEDVEKANPPQFDRVEDLATLRYLNESSLLHTIRQRYGSNLVHTNAGNSLLVINPMHPLSIYSEKVINMFRGCRAEDMPPHIYACAQQAYRNMLSSRMDQSIVLAGRSGSGKSTNVRHIMHYFTVAAGSINNVINVEKLNAMFTLLDAFGNSRTVMNTSATRYTSLLSLDFDHAGLIASASVQALMFEKTRITKRPEGEPTFHVFYQLLAGVDSTLRKELMLENLTETNMFMTPLQRPEDRQKATQAWAKIQHAMSQLDVTAAESKALVCVLAAIYHLGVAGATTGANNKAQFVKPASAQRASTVLGMTQEELSRAIFSSSQQTLKPTFRGGTDKQATAENLSAIECLEGFVTGLYGEVFNALVSLINRALASNVRTSTSVVILDCPGFQSPSTCGRHSGASFEDLCHNYINERLQLMFHDMIFTSQQDMYSQENIQCDFELVTSSPQALVSLIDKPSQQSLVRSSPSSKKSEEQKGLLWVLDDEAIYPGSTDHTFLERFMAMHKHEKKSSMLKKGEGTSFVLKHFQGTNSVLYDANGWLKACRENPVSRSVSAVLVNSHKEDISSVFSTFRTPGMPTTMSGSIAGMDGTSSLRRVSSMRRTYTSASAGLKRKSISLQVKFQTDSIVETLRRTKVHFVHCLLPQHNAGLSELRSSQLAPNKTVTSEDLMLNVPLMRSQLRGVELIEAIRIHRQGFPENMLFNDFRYRFNVLLPAENRPQEPVLDEKQAVDSILQQLELDKSSYRLGLSRVFFRSGGLAGLEDDRDERVTGRLVHVQALCRGFLARKNIQTLKVQNLAVQCIQRNVMKLKAIEDWPWWKLYTRVRPLLNVHRTEEELQMREIELEQIKVKFEKLERERNEYKITADRLESKLSETSADLAEEHTTSNHASEVLESEQAERRRLEKEVKDLTSKFGNLQRTHEKTELDLYDAQMLAAQLEGELGEDDVDGDDLYRERYQRLRRESEMRVKKLEKEQEEEREQFERDKTYIQKKLHEALINSEESEHLVVNWKKRQQRTTQEMADARLHLEEQVSRNTDLEKRQRRFDNELSKVTEYLREEKAMKDKLYRERDELAAEKYSIEQKLKDLTLDYDLQAEKVSRLDKELTDVTTSRVGDQGIVALKRHKNELESKLQEQEEELDEQAGTIQQLEQAKLRLEMGAENVRKKHLQEIEEKEQELEDMRSATQKKLKAMEGQLEEDYSDKQTILREKRELERKLNEMGDMAPVGNRDKEKKLRHELRRTKALYQDAQLVIKKHQEGAGSRTNVKQLRNQIEDLEYALQAAVKSRKSTEVELQDVQQQLDDMTKSKADSENRCIHLNREKTEILGQLEDNDEESAEIMKKYTALVRQQSTDHTLLQAQSKQIEDLIAENQALKETISQFESKVQYYNDSYVDRESIMRFESKIRDLESRFELEEVSRQRAENQLNRGKEQMECLSEERDKLSNDYQRASEAQRRLERHTRDAKEELEDVERKNSESSQRKYHLEKKLEAMEDEYEQSQSDLRLAFKRITDLQNIIEDSVATDSDESDLGDNIVDSDTDSDDSDVILHSSRQTFSARSSRIHSSRTSASESVVSSHDTQHIADSSC